MTLEDIYNSLSFGELRMLFLSGKDIDNPNRSGMPIESFMQLLPSIQLGLTELHKRFALREGHFWLDITPNIAMSGATYTITGEHTKSANPTSPLAYIDDLEMPFSDNLLKIVRCYGEQNNIPIELPLNEIADPGAIRTRTFNSLTIPTDATTATWLTETDRIQVVYRANHPEINKYIANEAPLITDIYIPHSHLEALLYYVASRVFNPIGMVPDSVHEGNNYAQKFEQACASLSAYNYQQDQDAVNEKLNFRGFC